MTRSVYIGGFGNGISLAEHVGQALSGHYEDVDTFTFSQAMKNPDTVRRAIRGVEAIAHSSGMLALKNTNPGSIHAFNAPVPISPLRLMARTLTKIGRMHKPGLGIKSIQDVPAVARFDLSSIAELLANAGDNFSHLGAIGRFDAVAEAIKADKYGIPTSLAYTHDDVYFVLPLQRQIDAELADIDIVMLPGEHDELLLRPEPTLDAYFARASTASLAMDAYMAAS